MRLFLVMSMWVPRDSSKKNENMTSLIDAKDEAWAIKRHVDEGRKRWPDHLHDINGLVVEDITDRAKRFVESWG